MTQAQSDLPLDHSMQFIDTSYPELLEIIKPSIGNPTKEKIQAVLEQYDTLNHHLIGCFVGTKLIGVIGIQLIGVEVIIKHISVSFEYRCNKIGTYITRSISSYFKVTSILAETDDESIGFYEKLGFKYESIESLYGKRYKCKLDVSLQKLY